MISELNIYKLIFEHAREGLLLTDNRGIIELVNPRLLEMFKYNSADELIGHPIEILIPRELRRKHVEHRINYYKKPDQFALDKVRPLEGSCKDDSRIYVDINLSHFNNENGEIKVLSFVTDITSAILTEQALRREKELNELKSRFVSMVSHEIRTPLSSIHTSATLISKYQRADQQSKRDKHTERIKRSVQHLTSILEDVLSLERMDKSGEEIVPVEILLPDTIDEIVQDLGLSESDLNRIDYRHSGKNTCYTDKKILTITIRNLLTNALKYSDPHDSVQLNTRSSSDTLFIKIRDEGIGIPESEQAVIFDRFFRASNALHIKGTGLGLSIVRGLLDKVEGEIVVDSIPGEFTEFKVTLPQLDKV